MKETKPQVCLLLSEPQKKKHGMPGQVRTRGDHVQGTLPCLAAGRAVCSPGHILMDAGGAGEGRVNQQLVEDISLRCQIGKLGTRSADRGGAPNPKEPPRDGSPPSTAYPGGSI